jgi:hypothetical protein
MPFKSMQGKSNSGWIIFLKYYMRSLLVFTYTTNILHQKLVCLINCKYESYSLYFALIAEIMSFIVLSLST